MFFLAFLPEVATFLIFIMMGTQLPQIGSILVLLQLGLIGLLFLYRTGAFVQVLTKWWWLILVPILAVVSALWSDLPAVSARYGAQFLLTAAVGVAMACMLTPRRFVTVFMLSMAVFCVLCIMNGRYGTSADGWVLIGLTGSKNQMAYAAQLLLLSSIAVLCLERISPQLRLAALLSLPLALYLVAGTNSATAVVMALIGTIVLLGMWVAQRLPPGARLGAVVLAVIVCAPLTMLIPEIIDLINHFVFDTLNKDPTLTGRTVLWQYADELIAGRPVLGYGYQAFWMGESHDANALKYIFNVRDGRTFHFHHQFRQIAVDVGMLGLVAFSLALLASGLAAVRQFLSHPSVATSFFFVVFMQMVARAFTDVIVGPFSIHTLLFFAASVYAFYRAPAAAPEPAPRAPARPLFARLGAVRGWRRG